MALNEACQLWIEQEGREAIERGENPADAGRRLSDEVLKYFETSIAPRTIEQKIRRMFAPPATNVASGGRPTKLQLKRAKTSDEQSNKTLNNEKLEEALYYAERLSAAFSEVLLNNQAFQINTKQDLTNFRFLRAYSPAIIRGFQYCDVNIERAANITKIKPLEDLEEIERKLLEG